MPDFDMNGCRGGGQVHEIHYAILAGTVTPVSATPVCQAVLKQRYTYSAYNVTVNLFTNFGNEQRDKGAVGVTYNGRAVDNTSFVLFRWSRLHLLLWLLLTSLLFVCVCCCCCCRY